MRKLGYDLELMVARLSGNDEQAKINLRAHQVRDRYKKALEKVYKKEAPLFLAHTNNVYIMKKDGVKTLIVYVDDSIFAAELNAQRELIRLKLLELFGEEIEQFDIHVSRGNYKQNHPYLVENEEEDNRTSIEFMALDEEELKCVSETSSVIEDEKVRKALESAMQANFKLQKIENDLQHGDKQNKA